jgi:flavin-binding protein dodecin
VERVVLNALLTQRLLGRLIFLGPLPAIVILRRWGAFLHRLQEKPIHLDGRRGRRRGFLLCLIVPSENNSCMSEHVYKKIEVVGSSPNGFEEAIKNALARAEKTVRNMRWFEVTETRGDVENGKVGHWQVTLKIGFTLE